jgi:holo-[acyl-carrier protein] synthase
MAALASTREPAVIVGIGIDLVDIARVERLVASKGARALERLFTTGERTYALSKTVPARHLAARVAAKEASFKALAGSDGARVISWRDMEVILGDDGRPEMVLYGPARTRAAELRVGRTWLTITHNATSAAAVVVLERE